MLRKPTQWLRRTVPQNPGRQILGPDPDGVGVRRVQLVLPESPSVAVVLGPQAGAQDGTDLQGVDDAGATPESIAEGRNYQWPEPDPGNVYEFCITPAQWITVIAKTGIAHVSVIVEYHDG
jgi:hypothetical protein